MSENKWVDDYAYMAERGFKYDPRLSQYSRLVNETTKTARWQHVSCHPDLKNPLVGYWVACSAPPDSGTIGIMDLVVRHDEGFTSPVLAYITAEVREWKRQA